MIEPRITPPQADAPRPTRGRRVARMTVSVLPTLFTLGNALCGFAAIFAASRPDDLSLPFGWTPLTFAAIFIFGGMLLDGLDGRIARLTRSSSELGEQLDSMSDMVTFGVAPAFVAVQLAGIGTPFLTDTHDTLFGRAALVVALIYVACAALRLARFNIEMAADQDDDHLFFKGLPTPGAAGTVASLVLLHQHFLARHPEPHWSVDAAAVVMVAVTLLVAVAMVSQFRYVHVMNRYVRGQAAFGTLWKVIICGLLLVVRPQWSLAAGFTVYALSAPVCAAWRTVMFRPRPASGATAAEPGPGDGPGSPG